MPHVDLTGVKEELELIPDGWFPATFSKVTYNEEAQNSGEPYLACQFSISDGAYEDRKLTRNYSLTKQSLWAFKRLLVRGLGVDREEADKNIPDVEEFMEELLGEECFIQVGHHKYNGELRNDLKNVLRTDDELDLWEGDA